jgi:hypothetical protein
MTRVDASEACSDSRRSTSSTSYGFSRAAAVQALQLHPYSEEVFRSCSRKPPAATSSNSCRPTYLMSNDVELQYKSISCRDGHRLWRKGSCRQEAAGELRSWILLPAAALIFLLLLVSDVMSVEVDAINGSLGSRFLVESATAANSTGFTMVSVDQILQQGAFSAIATQNLEEYIPHNVTVPATLSGVTAQAVRLVRHSFLARGVALQEFQIPIGTYILARVHRLIIVYQNFGSNLSSALFEPPQGLDFLSPVVSVAVYDASNITSVNPTQYGVNATAASGPIKVTFAAVSSPFVSGTSPLCTSFSSSTGNATSTGTSVATGNGPYVCNFTQLGAVALVGHAVATSPAPAPSPTVPLPGPKHKSNAWKIAVGVVVGVLGGLALLSLLAILAYRYREKRRFDQMHRNSDLGETLQQSSVGQSRAPVAGSTRTRPILEKFE